MIMLVINLIINGFLIINKIKEDKIKEGDILKVKFGYRDMVNYDYILDYEIIKQN